MLILGSFTVGGTLQCRGSSIDKRRSTMPLLQLVLPLHFHLHPLPLIFEPQYHLIHLLPGNSMLPRRNRLDISNSWRPVPLGSSSRSISSTDHRFMAHRMDLCRRTDRSHCICGFCSRSPIPGFDHSQPPGVICAGKVAGNVVLLVHITVFCCCEYLGE